MSLDLGKLENGWSAVAVDTPTIHFPDMCPACLSTGCSWAIPVQSDQGKFAGFFVVATRWRYKVVNVPFCEMCARRVRKRSRVGQILTAAGLIAGIGIAIWLDLGAGPSAVLAIALCAPGIFLSFGRTAVRLDVDDQGLIFQFKRKEYAEAFYRANGPEDASAAAQ